MKGARSLLVTSVAMLALVLAKETFGVPLRTVDTVSDGAIGTTGGGLRDSIRAVEPLTSEVLPSPGYSAPSGDETFVRMNASELRMRILQGARGTYIGDVLAARDSAITRWPDRVRRPLRVWVATPEQLVGWTPDLTSAVFDAFQALVDVGVPVRFDFVPDSLVADVHVRFSASFPNGISGKTVWSRDRDWWLVATEIELAVTRSNGVLITTPQLRAIAMHEVGHLLGLDHSSDSGDIMAERVHVRELSDADRLTARLIYSVPAGSLR